MSLCSHLTRQQSIKLYETVAKDNDIQTMQRLCKEDLFYLLVFALKRFDANRDWLYYRCREVEDKPDGMLDLWSRAHYKSSIITFAKSIQDILINPNITIGIFSHTRPIAKSFLAQIKREFESNNFLIDLFPDILYKNPYREAAKWSLDDGIIVKRTNNPKEATVEAWGLVDGQPTSRHFDVLNYDDVVTRESVTTPDMIKKTTEAFRLSLNLGSEHAKRRIIGTRYHANDTYRQIIEAGTAIPRIYPATEDGKMDGKPVLLTVDQLEDKKRDMGSYVFACQMLQNPLEDNAMGFKQEWIKHYHHLKDDSPYNYFIICDPATAKKRSSDYTVMLVIAVGVDNNYYLVDGIRDRLNLQERTEQLFKFVKKYRPIATGYEQYGMQCDIEHIEYMQEQRGYRFKIVPLGGQTAKNDRIRKLLPLFEQNRIFIPTEIEYVNYEGRVEDFVYQFIQDEYITFPVSAHDDMLDCLARIVDEDLNVYAPVSDGSMSVFVGREVYADTTNWSNL